MSMDRPSPVKSTTAPQTPRDVLSLAPPAIATVQLSALVFDLGNVLYDASAWQRWLLQLLNRIGLHTHYEAFFRVFERDYLQAVYCGQRDYWDALRDFLLAAGLSPGRVEEVLAAGHGKYRELWDDVRPLPSVSATLAQLAARGVRLCILSNAGCSAQRLGDKLRRLGLATRFEIVLSSLDLQAAKPAPECYQAAIAALGCPPDELGFVGQQTLELAGAGLAGMVTIAVNHNADAQADIYLDRFDQLLQVVAPRHPQQRVG
ncbi:MAG TPA: HAD family hydrolase [Pirellulaceae bacterium]|nr:HAD family hydrolase [Pirellulaceae bacterium]